MMNLHRRTSILAARTGAASAAIALSSLAGAGVALADAMPYYEEPAKPAAAAPAADPCGPGMIPVSYGPGVPAGAPCGPASAPCLEGSVPAGAPAGAPGVEPAGLPVNCVAAPVVAAAPIVEAAPIAPVPVAAPAPVAAGLPANDVAKAGGLGEVETPAAALATGRDVAPIALPAPAPVAASPLQAFLNSPQQQLQWGAAGAGVLAVIGGIAWGVIRRDQIAASAIAIKNRVSS